MGREVQKEESLVVDRFVKSLLEHINSTLNRDSFVYIRPNGAWVTPAINEDRTVLHIALVEDRVDDPEIYHFKVTVEEL